MITSLLLSFVICFLASQVKCLASTDTITWGGDNSRTGYQTNHNMDPSVVGSSQFGQLFKTALPGNYNGVPEQVFSQPLVYTTSDGIQYVYLATTQNNLYKMDAKTGVIVAQRNLHIPFLSADLNGCVDMSPHVGVTATGVIDPDTDTLYLTSKTYSNQAGGNGAQGLYNGRYYFHAINVNDLTERPNFPVSLEGTVAGNNPIRSFNGGIHHQRPALLHTGQFIYAGFASHCVQWNFTGWIMGWDKTTGAIVERFATEGAGVPNTTPGGGVWMSGGGIASDNAGSMFFATGNGYASQLSTIPVNGRNPPTSLEEAAVHMTINDDGSLTLVDFFMPWEKTQLDGADRDLGTSPLELLPSEFSCGSITRMGVVTGKSGKTYWLNLDDLGGYQNGPNKLDRVIQVYQNENSVYAGAGVYPLEGGYIYINVIQYPTHVFKFSCANGVPSFTKVADSPTNNAYILGVGHGTVTSLNGQPGTGLVWTSDVQGYNLRVYNAVPQNGVMNMINAFNVPGTTKFTRPVFGDGRVYMGTTQGYFYGFGSPVNLPLNCSSPYDFGTANLNSPTASKTVTCTALIPVTVTNITLTGPGNFNITGVPAAPLNLAAGATFSFQAYFNPQNTGTLSSDVVVSTTNGVAGYSTSIPISLEGQGQSVSALLSVSPVTLAFQGVITGQQTGGVNQTVLFTNQGNSPLTISNIQYSQTSEQGPFVAPNTTLSGPKVGPFTFIGLPSMIPGNTVVSVIINFDTSASGNFAAYVQVSSNGGNRVFDVVGTSGSAPVALVEFQTTDGSGWVQYVPGTNFTFGNVTEQITRSLELRLTNNAAAGSAPLSLTVSKPPFGVPGIIGAVNQVDLAEGTILNPGESATATLYCSVPKQQWNMDPYQGHAQWTMNTDDPNFNKQFIQFDCLAVSEQAAPLQPNGQGVYRYVGCFKENNPGRQLTTQLYGSPNNTIAMCTAACASRNFQWCAVQYNSECWGGPTIPILQVDEGNCDFPCSGDINQICGGNGIGNNTGGAFMSLFGTNGTVTTPTGPFVNPGVANYTSLGCYTEGTGTRALPQQITIANKTVSNCLAGCAASNYIYSGLEYGGECWCGNAFGTGAVPAPASSCSMTCSGNATEYCGAGGYLNAYQHTGPFPPPPTTSLSTSTASSTSTSVTSSTPVPTLVTQPSINNGAWVYQGCYTEATPQRALSSTSFANNSMTLELCAAFCSNFKMFGTEFGRECYCGNSLNPGSVLAFNQNDCNMPCASNASEYCGAGNRLELYAIASQTVSSSSSLTSLTSISSTSSSASSVSNSLTTSPSTPPTSSPTTSSLTSTSTTSTSISTTSTSISTTSSSSISPTPSPSRSPKRPIIVPVAGSYTYLGCYTEATNIRALSLASFPNNNNTIEACVAACSAYSYAGAEYGRECYCGNSFNTGSVLTADSDCNMPCAGNASEFCGAGNRLSVYGRNGAGGGSSSSASAVSTTLSSSLSASSTTLSSTLSASSTTLSSTLSASSTTLSSSLSASSTTLSSTSPTASSTTLSSTSTSSTTSSATPTPTGPSVSPGNANYTYYSCVSEPSNGRLLPSQILNNGTSMSIEMCLSACSQLGNLNWCGVEYGRECWAGSTLNIAGNAGGTPSMNVTDSQCSFLCPGNAGEFCGAGNRLSLYVFNGTRV